MGIRRKTLTVSEDEKYRSAVYEASKAVATMLLAKGVNS
jgi:ATP-dependent Zn protease